MNEENIAIKIPTIRRKISYLRMNPPQCNPSERLGYLKALLDVENALCNNDGTY